MQLHIQKNDRMILLPSIEFRCSWFFQRYVCYNLQNFYELYKFTNRYSKFIKPYLERILLKIKELTGFKWKDKEITVWLIDGFQPSISFPLLLNWYGGDKFLTTFTLIHELVHRNISDIFAVEDGNFNPILLEALVNLISKKVIIEVFSSQIFEAIKKRVCFDKKYSEVWKLERELEREIDLKRPLKKIITKNKRFTIRKNWWKKIEFTYPLIV